MILTSADRFRSYVEHTSRPMAWEKRKALIHELSERFHQSVSSLVSAVKGNAGDRVWVAGAIRDGEIVRHPEHRAFRLAEGLRGVLPPHEIARRAAELAQVVEALMEALPEDYDGDEGALLMRSYRALQLVGGTLEEDWEVKFWREQLGLDSAPGLPHYEEQDDREEGDES